MSRVVVVVVACLLVSACSAGPENFWRGVQRGVCKFNRKCASSQEPLADCTERSYSEAGTPDAFGEACTDFDSESARECLRYVREARASCSGLSGAPTACEGVCGPGSSIGFVQESGYSVAAPTDEGSWAPVLIAE